MAPIHPLSQRDNLTRPQENPIRDIKRVEMMRAAGAKEVHMRISSPPTTNSCFYGVDTPERNKLLAANLSVEEMTSYIKVDSLAFISIDGLYRAMGLKRRTNEQPEYCDACFTGDYPLHAEVVREHLDVLTLPRPLRR